MQQTLDAVPFDGTATSVDVGEKLKITPSLAAARLKLLFDNNVVRRAKGPGGKYLYTRSKQLLLCEAAEEKAEMADNVSIRPKVAEFLKGNVGKRFTLETIIEKASTPFKETRQMMSDLVSLGYVTLYTDGKYEIEASIVEYKPLVRRRSSNDKSDDITNIDDLAGAIKKIQKQRDDARAALELIYETVKEVLGK